MSNDTDAPRAPMHEDAGGTGAATKVVADLINQLRPERRDDPKQARDKLQRLVRDLHERQEYRNQVKTALLALFTERQAVLLFATTGIFPSTGMASEAVRRMCHRLLPRALEDNQLKDVLPQIFRRSDAAWLETLTTEDWASFIRALQFGSDDESGLTKLFDDLLEGLRVVSHRIAASGLEPEMLRLDPTLELHESPFLAQCEEALAFASRIKQARCEGSAPAEDERHYLVLLDQCKATITQIRKRATQLGASFRLTFFLQRLNQHIDRAQKLAILAMELTRGPEADETAQASAFFHELAIEECRRNDLKPYWRQNLELVALRVCENAGRAGGHYISKSRSEHFSLLYSALGGGFIIAFMAANKIWMDRLGLAPLTEVLAFCLNYALGFVLIHILHFTVATKQPAMTANAIAAAIDESGGSERDMEPLAGLVASTIRSQLAAILGNVGLAIPVAMLIALALHYFTGEHFVPPDQAIKLLEDVDPIASGAVFYAAVAGVCLFLAGLISGYLDNMCIYNKIPQRLLRLDWPVRILGAKRWTGIVAYIEGNLGALAGNFGFGFLLGGAAGLGVLLGLPLDIRHIAFSSSYWGYALIGLEFSIEWTFALLTAAGVLAIGLANLLVSFYLALWVGLTARGVTFAQKRGLARAIWRRLKQQPREFFLPPPRTIEG